jgi:hypothetical protein
MYIKIYGKVIDIKVPSLLVYHLLSIRAEHQIRIRPNLHPSYNERHQK